MRRCTATFEVRLELWATWLSWRCPCSLQGELDKYIQEVTSNSYNPRVLWVMTASNISTWTPQQKKIVLNGRNTIEIQNPMKKSQSETEPKSNNCLPADFKEQAQGKLERCHCTKPNTTESLSSNSIPNRSLSFTFFIFSHQLVRRRYGSCPQILISNEYTFVPD